MFGQAVSGMAAPHLKRQLPEGLPSTADGSGSKGTQDLEVRQPFVCGRCNATGESLRPPIAQRYVSYDC